jgi:hypothetical protein
MPSGLCACPQPCFCLRWAHSGWLRGPRHKQTAPRAVLGATLDCAQLTSEWLHSKSQPHRSGSLASPSCAPLPPVGDASKPGWGGARRGSGDITTLLPPTPAVSPEPFNVWGVCSTFYPCVHVKTLAAQCAMGRANLLSCLSAHQSRR